MYGHLKYIRYLFFHKWYVFVAGRRLHAPLFRLIIHDWTKLLPQEWFPYTHFFYGSFPPWEQMKHRPYSEWKWSKEAVEERFQQAWLHHIHWNKHHWQHFVLIDDPARAGDEHIGVLPMPDKYIREMVADWLGAGRALRGYWDAGTWYQERKEDIMLHSGTRMKVEWLLEKAATWRD
jgi:uncharacterized protein DUF5662